MPPSDVNTSSQELVNSIESKLFDTIFKSKSIWKKNTAFIDEFNTIKENQQINQYQSRLYNLELAIVIYELI